MATDVDLSNLFEFPHDEACSVGNDATPVHSLVPPIGVGIVSIILGGHRQ
jgi:hypothetical protein